ncbi:glycosyltransferase family 2 protein, partial [Candidatus Desantisbacteria bacterium]|nr:glycosyltransferase family 2 protein [Candidatus Desantisbacteria bacterium]
MAKKWIESKYKTQNKNSIKSGVDPSSKRNIIISLTSHPKRFKQNYIAIESLLSQSLKPNKIILWLAEDEASFDEVSEELKRAQKRGLEIAFCRQSLRSYNKLIHTLKIYGDSIIVTADDDIMYPDYWLKELYETYLENSDCIICYRGLEIKYSQNAFEKYFLWKDFK